MDQLGEGRASIQVRSRAGQEAHGRSGLPQRLPGHHGLHDLRLHRSWSTPCQLVLKHLKDVGIDVKLNQKEYGAYISTSFYGKFDSMCLGPQTGFQEPDNFLFGQYYPGELKNQSHINDPVVADMLIRQRRTADVAKRREIIHDIQRHLAKQQYYVQLASAIQIAVWEGALKNYAPERELRLRRPARCGLAGPLDACGHDLSRRDLLKAGGGALAAAAVGPAAGASRGPSAQTPKRGGTISLRLWDPPHFDPHLTISYKTNILYTFTHSRLLKYKAGPGVSPGQLHPRRRSRRSPGPSPTRPRTSSSSARASAGTPSRP